MVCLCIESLGNQLSIAKLTPLFLGWTILLNKMVYLTHLEYRCHGYWSDAFRYLHLQKDFFLYLGVKDLHDGVGAH